MRKRRDFTIFCKYQLTVSGFFVIITVTIIVIIKMKGEKQE